MLRSVLVAGLVAPVVVGIPAASTAEPVARTAELSNYQPSTPARVLDTRTGVGAPTGKVGPASTVTVDLSARLPETATAVVLNVTGIAPGASTLVMAHQHGTTRPTVPNLLLMGTEIRSGLVTVPVGADRKVDLYNNAGNIDLTADLFGYYATDADSLFTPQQGERVAPLTIGARQTTKLDLAKYVDSSATAAAVSLTVSPSASTYLTAWTAGTTRPAVSSLNTAQPATNLALVALDDDRTVSIYNHAGTVTLHVDLVGFYSDRFGASFVPSAPTVVFDTRSGLGTRDNRAGAIAQGAPAEFLPGAALPDTAIATMLNLTAFDATTATGVTVDEIGGSRARETTDLTVPPNRITAGLGIATVLREHPNQRAYVHNAVGSTHVVAALSGYFVARVGGCVPHCVIAEGANLGNLGIGTTTSTAPPTKMGLYFPLLDAGDGWALRTDGQLWQWGMNRKTGPIGWHDGRSTVPVFAPVRDIEQVWHIEDSGDDTIIVRRSDGTVWGWGQQLWYRLNESTDLNQVHRTPVPVHGLTDVVALDGTHATIIAAHADGTVWGWGLNLGGSLGFPQDEGFHRPAPVRIPGPANVTEVHAGTTVFARTADGDLWSWGGNGSGLLGTGSTANTGTPARITGLAGVTSVSTGNGAAYAITSDGALWAWGSNSRGQLGNGTVGGFSNVPVRVAALDGAAAEVVAEGNRVFVRTVDGAVWAWGDNRNGGLGNGESCTGSCDVPTPRPNTGLSDIVQVLSGQALDENGTVWRWGHVGEDGRHVTVPTQRTDLSNVVELLGNMYLTRSTGR